MPGSDPHCVDVLIVNWNTSDLLEQCLKRLFALPEIEQLNVIVIDNASQDGSADMAATQFPAATVLTNDVNQGFARANNQGFRRSSSPYVLLLNSDTQVEPGTISYCRDHLAEHPDVGVVGCRISNPDGTPQSSVFRYPSLRGVASTSLWLAQAFPRSPRFNHDRYGHVSLTEPTSVEVVMGSFLMVRRADVDGDVLDDGFFMYAEEADLCRRMREKGLDVRFLPEVALTHVKGASSRTAEQRAWSDEAKKRSVLRFLGKWEGGGTAYLANLIMLLGTGPRTVGWALTDLRARLTGGETGRLKKAGAIRFHLGSVVRPSLMSRRFHGPPEDD